jgi:hypothetical protein
MPVTIEAIATGVVLVGAINLTTETTEVERGALGYALDQLSVAGGKTGSGFGALAVTHDGDAEPYRAWLEDMGTEDLRARLVALAETLA